MRTIWALSAKVPGFQCRAQRSRKSSAKASIGCPGVLGPLSFLAGSMKVAEGRLEDIRECIGCNICVSGDFTMSRSAAPRIR